MKDVIDVMALQRDKPRSRQPDYISAPGNTLAIHYIFECGVKLNAQPATIATAAVLFHKFFKEVDKSNYDCYVNTISIYITSVHYNNLIISTISR